MNPVSPEEDFIADVLADALRGQLTVGFGDVARIAMSAQRIAPERIAPLTLAKWVACDPRALHLLRVLVQRAAGPPT
jgi:hypothetical protein